MPRNESNIASKAKRKLNLDQMDQDVASPAQKSGKRVGSQPTADSFETAKRRSVGKRKTLNNTSIDNDNNNAIPPEKDKIKQRQCAKRGKGKGQEQITDQNSVESIRANDCIGVQTEHGIDSNNGKPNKAPQRKEMDSAIPGGSGVQTNTNFGANQMYDGIDIDVDTDEDVFSETDEVVILPRKPEDEEIPPEVVEKLKEHLVMQEYIGQVVDKRISKLEEYFLAHSSNGKGDTTDANANAGKEGSVDISGLNRSGNHRLKVIMTKSPSETTIYKPGLHKDSGSQPEEIINRISNFVEEIRIGHRKDVTPNRASDNVDKAVIRTDCHQQQQQDCDTERNGKREKCEQDSADHVVLEAEQLRVQIQPPKGKESFDFNKFLQNLDDDDEFFHVTCHIDETLRAKIAKGEFVDLEKLLPKDCGSMGGVAAAQNTESKVELVSKDGHTYFRPVRESQINGLRKWEQAFRIYAAIYTNANPSRAHEIWQYIHVINVAASSYQWENVASYDLTFRQLMAFKPQCSWAKTYLQGWNLALRDPIGGANKNFNTGLQVHDKSFGSNNFQGGNGRCDWRDNCCWKFDRNKCNSSNCNFDHRCTYCGGWNHGFYNCRKRLRKESGNSSNNGNGSNGNSHGSKRRHHSPHKR